jgi:uncharacterized protein (DUF433 family)
MTSNTMSATAPEHVGLCKYVELRDNRPHNRGQRLPIASIAAAEATNHLSISELAYQFTLSDEQVLAALLYYREHKAEIDPQHREDAQQSEDMHQRYGKKPTQA